MWPPPEAEGTVDAILNAFTDVASLLLRDEGIDDVTSSMRYAEAVGTVERIEIAGLIENFERRAAALITPKIFWPWAILLSIWDDARERVAHNRRREG